MTAPQVIDIEALLAPISEEAPAGTDPRGDTSNSSLYYKVKDARNAARSAERAAVDVDAPYPQEWETLVEAATELLTVQAKDIEVGAWLIEGLVRSDGFAGLRDGLKVMTGIVENYWEQCFPELDEDGVEGKVSAVAGLNGSGAIGTLIQPIRLTELTQGSQESLSYWNYEQAVDLEKVADEERKAERRASGIPAMEDFMRTVAETPAQHFASLIGLVEECSVALKEMSAAFDAVAGVDAPSVSAIQDLLGSIAAAIRHVASDKLSSVAVDDEVFADEGEAQAEGGGGGGGGSGGGAVRRIDGYATREEALAELARIASYFRKTEPHSLISYTLDDAIRRARMALPDLLNELTDDPAQIQRLLLAAGIRSIEPAES